MKEIAKITKTKKGYVLKEKIWRMMIVKTQCGYMTIEIQIPTDYIIYIAEYEVCAICGKYEQITTPGPWVFAGKTHPVCKDCIKTHLPDLVPELKRIRAKWLKKREKEKPF